MTCGPIWWQSTTIPVGCSSSSPLAPVVVDQVVPLDLAVLLGQGPHFRDPMLGPGVGWPVGRGQVEGHSLMECEWPVDDLQVVVDLAFPPHLDCRCQARRHQHHLVRGVVRAVLGGAIWVCAVGH